METPEITALKEWLKNNLNITTNIERERFSNNHTVTVILKIDDEVISYDSFQIEIKDYQPNKTLAVSHK